jgi:hypothetical protein
VPALSDIRNVYRFWVSPRPGLGVDEIRERLQAACTGIAQNA